MSSAMQGMKVIVSGAASGIGLATADLFEQMGASVARFDRTPISAGKGLSFALDITDETQVADAVTSVDEALGGIDVMVNTAGILLFGPLLETPVADARRVLDVNLIGTFLMVRETVRVMKKRGKGGKVILFSSARAAWPPGACRLLRVEGGYQRNGALLGEGVRARHSRQCSGSGADRYADARLRKHAARLEAAEIRQSARPHRPSGGDWQGRAVSCRTGRELHDGTGARRQRRRLDGLKEGRR